jgi:hypothetical protein
MVLLTAQMLKCGESWREQAKEKRDPEGEKPTRTASCRRLSSFSSVFQRSQGVFLALQII